jgi:thiazole/oxazole-forming peptide maturase SagD family component
MRASVDIVGRNDASRQLVRALSAHGIEVGSSSDMVILAEWESVNALLGATDAARRPLVVVEGTSAGGIAFGPLFRSNAAGCVRCYIARRRANGGSECRPTTALTDHAADHIARSVRQIVDGNALPLSDHIEIGAPGGLLRHTLFPVPRCAHCSHRPFEKRTLDLDALVSPRIGLVHQLRLVAGAPDGMIGVEAVGSRTDALGPARALNKGMAVDECEETARLRAVAESIERYCAALPIFEMPLARSHELDGPAFAPSRFPNTFESFDRGRRHRWMKARTLATGTEVWVPASLVYVPYLDDSDDSSWPQSSVGLAVGRTIEDAVQRGIAEIVERDACLKAWRWCLPVEGIEAVPISLPGLHLSRVPTDTDFEVVVAFLEQTRFPLTSSGLAARPSLVDAARHATLEALQSRIWLEQAVQDPLTRYENPPRTMIDNAMAHASWPHLSASRSRWLHPPRNVAAAPNGKHWRIAGAHNAAALADACYVDISTPDVEAAGLKVVRTLIPSRVVTDDDSFMPVLGGMDLPHPFG